MPHVKAGKAVAFDLCFSAIERARRFGIFYGQREKGIFPLQGFSQKNDKIYNERLV